MITATEVSYQYGNNYLLETDYAYILNLPINHTNERVAVVVSILSLIDFKCIPCPFKKNNNYFRLTSIKLLIKAISEKPDVTIIMTTRIKPIPPISIDLGKRIPTNAAKIINVNVTAI